MLRLCTTLCGDVLIINIHAHRSIVQRCKEFKEFPTSWNVLSCQVHYEALFSLVCFVISVIGTGNLL